jgi:hypothetical protein
MNSFALLCIFGLMALCAYLAGLLYVARQRVDPWRLQRRLMEVSGQEKPDGPMLTRDSLLYYALILEEVKETGEALYLALDRARFCVSSESGIRSPLHTVSPGAQLMLGGICNHLNAITGRMGSTSTALRNLLKLHDGVDLHYALSLDEARPLLDGTNDVSVVNCGFALACGLPGAPGYLEVGNSNLSKVDPTTGRIERDPSGKWIKGPKYQEPNLNCVLVDHAPRGWFDDDDEDAYYFC